MEMTTCSICGKIFGSSGRGLCGQCQKLLDIVYEKARSYLRDNPKAELSAPELAKAIKEDVRLIELLMLEGRFETDPGKPSEDPEEKKRRQLLESLQKNLSSPAAREQRATTYGSDRHGRE